MTAQHHTSISMPAPLAEALKTHARRCGRSVSAILCDAAARELRAPCNPPSESARFVDEVEQTEGDRS